MKRTWSVLVLLVVAACNGTTREPGSVPAGDDLGHGTQAPLRVEVQGPANVTSGSEIDLDIVLTRTRATADPIVMHVQVPAGATLVSGAVDETIRDASNAVLHRALRLGVAAVPEQDLLVQADVHGAGFGAHAQGSYRFGRAAPVLPSLPRAAGSGGKHGLGAPVRVNAP